MTSNLSNRFFENQPNEIYSHLSEKALKGRFLKLEKKAPKSQQQRKRKGEKKERGEGKEENRKKKATVADSGLVFIIATLEIDLRRKNCGTQTEGPFGDNVFKTPASLYL